MHLLNYLKFDVHLWNRPQTLYIIKCWKHTIDKSLQPEIMEEDLKERFVRGHGPGGQNINKTSNCVVLKHLPTGIVVKCHHTRSQQQNRVIARQLLQEKLDNLLNGDNSVSAQEKKLDEEKSRKREQRARHLRELKITFKQREGLD